MGTTRKQHSTEFKAEVLETHRGVKTLESSIRVSRQRCYLARATLQQRHLSGKRAVYIEQIRRLWVPLEWLKKVKELTMSPWCSVERNSCVSC